MKIEKQVITKVEQNINIKEITLLSVEEYEQCKEHIALIEDWWWIRSHRRDQDRAALVSDTGSILIVDDIVDGGAATVRPTVVLRLNKTENPNLQTGDMFEMAGFSWTMIAKDMALCDTGVGNAEFREDWRADDANMYEVSDVKKWLDNWAAEHNIIGE